MPLLLTIVPGLRHPLQGIVFLLDRALYQSYKVSMDTC